MMPKPFIPAWLDDAGLSPAEMRVFVHLLRSADNKTGVAWPSYRRMTEITGLGKSTVRRSIESLEKPHGLIQKIGKPFAGSCRYRVLPIVPPQGQMEDFNSSTTGTIETTPIVPPQTRNSSTTGTPIVPPEGQEGSPKKDIQRRVSNKEGLLDDAPTSNQSKARGTLEELTAYAVKIGLPESDGESMFLRFEENGWMNGRSKVKCWQSSMKRWKHEGWHPSQKAPSRPESHDALVAHAKSQGIAEPVATAWWDRRQALGWRINGQPIAEWKADLIGFVEAWHRNEAKK
jgi:hypothetical protein